MGVEFNKTILVGISLVNPVGYGLYTRVAVSPKIKIGFQYEFNDGNTELGSFTTNEFTLSYGFN